MGTPKTLREAIENGQKASAIEDHVRDFLAQRFGERYLSEPDAVVKTLIALFNDITSEKK